MNERILKWCARVKRYFKYTKIKKLSKDKKYTHLYIGSPVHSNLGDHQISVSAQEFLKKNGIKFIELSMFDYYNMRNLPFKNVKVVCLQGGGNFGDVYLDDIQIRDDVVRRFKDKKIVIFPQTIYCENNTSNSEVFVTKQIFDNHDNVVICAREKKSYEKFKTLFDKNKIILAPDIVISSNYVSKFKSKRSGALFLMRTDHEKVLSHDELKTIETAVKSLGYKTSKADTVIDYWPYELFRNQELKKIFKKIAQAEFVVTDRLHGMIFAAITNTPCVVTANYNFKIQETYENWLKEFKFIKFTNRLTEKDVQNAIVDVLKTDPNWNDQTEKFNELKKEIKND